MFNASLIDVKWEGRLLDNVIYIIIIICLIIAAKPNCQVELTEYVFLSSIHPSGIFLLYFTFFKIFFIHWAIFPWSSQSRRSLVRAGNAPILGLRWSVFVVVNFFVLWFLLLRVSCRRVYKGRVLHVSLFRMLFSLTSGASCVFRNESIILSSCVSHSVSLFEGVLFVPPLSTARCAPLHRD